VTRTQREAAAAADEDAGSQGMLDGLELARKDAHIASLQLQLAQAVGRVTLGGAGERVGAGAAEAEEGKKVGVAAAEAEEGKKVGVAAAGAAHDEAAAAAAGVAAEVAPMNFKDPF
jgi:hypothetical protein